MRQQPAAAETDPAAPSKAFERNFNTELPSFSFSADGLLLPRKPQQAPAERRRALVDEDTHGLHAIDGCCAL